MGRALESAITEARSGERAEPPVPAPGPLQRFLGFRKLPPAARAVVARCLDDDEGFRARVAESVGEDVDRPSALFLQRPDGWADELAALAADHAEVRRAEGESRRIRELESELERQSIRHDELDRLARDAAAAERELKAELDEIRRQRRSLTDDLDAAVARSEASDAAVTDARRRAEEAEAALVVRDRELADARRRLDELEAELERRPPAPDEAPSSVEAEPVRRALDEIRRQRRSLTDDLDAA
ncbi:MAG: hypothetical protein AAGK32_21590, partial [Actinomycetota bacterium]